MKPKLNPIVFLPLLAFAALMVIAFVPSLTDFNANQFYTGGNQVSIKSGVRLTNANFYQSFNFNGVMGSAATGSVLILSGTQVETVTPGPAGNSLISDGTYFYSAAPGAPTATNAINSTNFWGLLSPTNLPAGLSTSNYVGTFFGDGSGLSNTFGVKAGTGVTTSTNGNEVTVNATASGGGGGTNALTWLSFDQTANSGLTNVVVDFTHGTEFAIILTTNAFFTTPTNRPLTNWVAAGMIRVYQDGTGGRRVGFTNGATSGAWKTPGAQTLVCTTNADAASMISYTTSGYGTNQWYVWGLNFQ